MSQAQRRAGGRGTDGQWAGQQGRPPAKVGGCFMWEPAAVHWFGKRVIGKNSIRNTASVYNPPPACVCVCVFMYTRGFWFVSVLLKIQDVAPSCFLMSRGAPPGSAHSTFSFASREACELGMLETAARKTTGRSRTRGVLRGWRREAGIRWVGGFSFFSF